MTANSNEPVRHAMRLRRLERRPDLVLASCAVCGWHVTRPTFECYARLAFEQHMDVAQACDERRRA